MFTPGDKIGAHRIVARIATGGMATVFLAQREGEEGASSYVIIKAIHRQLSNDAHFRAMFLDEARLAQRLRHPNVVTAGELGEHHGVLYLVMELVHGVSLRQLLEALAADGRRLIPEVAVYLAIRAAEGLHAAHTLVGADGAPLSVVHRDVTPDNLLVGFDGGLRVIDFGVAKARDRIAPTSMGVLKGKFGYMAPEQARGTAVDARTDVFALAIVLWETLTAKRVATFANDAEALAWARSPSFKPIASLIPDFPPALDAAIARALSTDPNARPESMSAFASELVAACPGASQGTPGHISMLLATVITPRVEETRLAMPPDVAEILNDLRPRANPDSLAQLTLKLADGYDSDFGASGSGPTEVARASMVMASAAKSAVAIAPAVKIQGQTPVGYKPPAPATGAKPAPKPVPKPVGVAPKTSPTPVAKPAAAAPGAAAPTPAPAAAEPPTVVAAMAEPPTVVTPFEPPTVSDATAPSITAPAMVAPPIVAPAIVAPAIVAPPVETFVAPPPAPAEGLVPSSPPPAMVVPAPVAPPAVAAHAQGPVADPAPPYTAQPQSFEAPAPQYAPPTQPYSAPAQPAEAMGHVQPAPAPVAQTAPQSPTANAEPQAASKSGGGKKVVGILIGLVVLSGIVYGGYYGYARYRAAQALAAATATAPPVVVPPTPSVPPIASPVPTPPAPTPTVAVPPADAGAQTMDASAPADAAVADAAVADAAIVDAAPEAAAPAPAPAPSAPPTMQATALPAMTSTPAMTATPTMTSTPAMTTTMRPPAMQAAPPTMRVTRPDF